MSLFRRIWLAVIALTIAAFAGSLLVNTFTARSYLEKQLYLKNLDNATALALSMSQFREKDPVTIELLVSAQFDTGHYQEIRLTDPAGTVLVERRQESVADLGAPAWFVRLFPIQAKPGIAHVQDGWKQFGSISLQSHGRFAYEALWQGTLELTAWFLAGGILAGLLGTLMLRLITRPLDRVVGQAHAISKRQFTSIDVPKVPELRSVALAMNDMVARLKQMFADEAARLESLRRQVNHDAITGLPNREFFIGRLRDALVSEDAASHGLLAMIRLVDLNAINSQLGHAGADTLLQGVAAVLADAGAGPAPASRGDVLTARVRGADFALLLPQANAAAALAETLAQGMRERVAAAHPGLENLFHVGVVHYRRGQALDALLANADNALAIAEAAGPNAWHAGEPEAGTPLATSGEGWRSLLSDALTGQRIKLASFPVMAASGVAIHQESVVRLQTRVDGPWLSAGDFMPMAERLKLTAELDLQVVRMALAGLQQTGASDIAINLSADTIADWGFHNRLVELLKAQPALCRRLWIEVAEQGVFRQPEAFRDLCRTLKSLGCHVGIEHFGHRFAEIARISDLGLDYLKVDGSFIRDIHVNPGNQEFLKGLCNMAHSIGVSVIAEGVGSADELAFLPGLGFDGVTGPAVS
jgi:diguanylate cyclase (GGDEF)-like protein